MLAELDSTLGAPDPPQEISEPQKVTSELLATEETTVDEDEEVVDEFEEFVTEKAQALTELVLSQCEEDRAEATEAINMIKDLIKSQDKVVHGGTLQRLLQAIDTRSGINMILVKALESQAKILSARKGPSKHINNNNTTTVESKSLIQMLESGLKQ